MSFTQTDPELSILLSNNRLTRCPGAIFDLQNLTVLSLRGNRLTEISPAVLNLTNLTQLNVSLNALTHLPMELLELLYDKDSKLSTLFIHPNPFHQPEQNAELVGDLDRLSAEGLSNCSWLRKPADQDGFHARKVSRTPVHFLGWRSSHDDGKHFGSFSQFQIPDTQSRLETEEIGQKPVLPVPLPASANQNSSTVTTTKVLSLFELCLQTIPLKYPANTDWAEHVRYLGIRKNLPNYEAEEDHLVKILQDVDVQYEAGFKTCTVCRRQVVKPAAQWIEWWDIFTSHTSRTGTSRTMSPLSANPEERLVPFLRQTCTWACVNDPIRGLSAPPSETEREGDRSQ